jgi:hypothetical protein
VIALLFLRRRNSLFSGDTLREMGSGRLSVNERQGASPRHLARPLFLLLQIITRLDELKAGCVLDEMPQPKGMA